MLSFLINKHNPDRQRLLAIFAVVSLFFSGFAHASTALIELNDEERQWLSEHSTIRLAVDIDWSPFEYIDADRQHVGMAAEYISLVEKKLGIHFEIEKSKPWSEVVTLVKNRDLDVYSCVVSTAQRREYVDFTKPYLSFPMVIVTSDKVTYVNGLSDFQDETVAVVRGYATQDLLEKNHPDLNLFLADNVTQALEQVSLGKVYAYVGNIATVSDVIRREGLTNIKISGETAYRFELSMGVRNDWPEFTPILQKALDSITPQERDQIYRNWIKLRYEHGFEYDLLWQILAVVFLVVAVVLIWNRRLSNEVVKRIEAENALQLTHQQLEQTNKQLVNYVDIVDKYVITSSTDTRGIITSISTAFCEISGYERSELIGNSHNIVRHEDMPKSVYKELWDTVTKGETWSGKLHNRKKNGDSYWTHAYISPNFDDQGQIEGYTAIREDISDRMRAEELSITDELTSLFNRRHFSNLFPLGLERARRDQKSVTLIIIDVDFFKLYNDHYGHQQGDHVLREVASALKVSLRRAGDLVFRIGGEEFATIASVTRSEDALLLAEKLRHAVESLKLEHAKSPVSDYVTISLGVNVYKASQSLPPNVDEIFKMADDALYKAKENGRNRVAATEEISPVPVSA
jgi:diguanylate cyclase (GGDEF)-like protein/PAS domain S-box-containing protein